MSLIDSSAWIELFRATGSETHERLRSEIVAGEMQTTGPVQMELLAGARDVRERRLIRRALAACELLAVKDSVDWEQAASIYAACRRGGAAPRKLVDCLIAAVAIRNGTRVLAQDRDFERIAEHSELQLAG